MHCIGIKNVHVSAGCALEGYNLGRFSRKCYKVNQTPKKKWRDAQAACQADGGELASVDSPMEQRTIEGGEKRPG